MTTVRVDLSSKLRALRERHNWNQSEAAAFIGVDRTQVSRWERGQRCGVSCVAHLLALGLRLSTATATGSLDAPGKPFERLALVREMVCEAPEILDAPAIAPPAFLAVKPATSTKGRSLTTHEMRETAIVFARMSREQGDEAKAAQWDARAVECRAKIDAGED